MRRFWLLSLLFVFGAFQSMFGKTFSQLALGGLPGAGEHYECIILISNMSDEAWHGRMTALTGNDQNWTVRWVAGETQLDTHSVNVDLVPRGTLKVTLKSVDGSLGTGYLNLNWRYVSGASIENTLAIAVTYFYNLLDQTGDVLDCVSVPESRSDTEFMLPVEYIPNKVDTGIAWSPSSDAVDAQFSLHFELVDASGTVVATSDRPYEGQNAKFVSELFPQAAQAGAFIGRVRITSDGIGMCTTALRLVYTRSGIQLTGAPPERLY